MTGPGPPAPAGPPRAPSITVTANGAERSVPAGTTVAEVLVSLSLPPDRVAVERNRDIVPRDRHASTTLADGDRLEIVTLVGGG